MTFTVCGLQGVQQLIVSKMFFQLLCCDFFDYFQQER